MIDDLATWKSTYKDLAKVADNSWALNFALWVNDRVSGKAQVTGVTTSVPENVFVFNYTIFKTQLEALTPTTDINAGITKFADAWETAMNASLVLGVLPGDFVGASSPSTTWSVVSTALIDGASVSLGKAKIMELVNAPLASTEDDSVFPEYFRDAFLLLTGTISGLNSVPPTAGPNPLNVVAASLY